MPVICYDCKPSPSHAGFQKNFKLFNTIRKVNPRKKIKEMIENVLSQSSARFAFSFRMHKSE